MSNFPKVHPRHQDFTEAKLEIAKAVTDMLDRHPDVTYAEMWVIFCEVSRSWAGYALHDEREDSGA